MDSLPSTVHALIEALDAEIPHPRGPVPPERLAMHNFELGRREIVDRLIELQQENRRG